MARLFIVCERCGNVEHMDPSEMCRGGDAHHFLYSHHQNGCGQRYKVGVLDESQINDFYDKPLSGRMAMLRDVVETRFN